MLKLFVRRAYTRRNFVGNQLCGFFLVSRSSAQNRTNDTSRSQSRLIEQAVATYLQDHPFMGTVLLARDGEILFVKNYGRASLEWNVPFTRDTKFRIGSITKQFTAAAILLLQERGKLKTNDSVTTYFSQAPESWKGIKIHHLLNHTSGIPDYARFPDIADMQKRTYRPIELIATFLNKPVDFPAGDKWQYSNSGYAVLGHVVEQLSGQSLGDFLEQHLLTPAGMKDSGFGTKPLIVEQMASSYRQDPSGAIHPAEYTDMTVPYAAGALYSTAPDLLRWVRALFAGKLLQSGSLEQMTTRGSGGYGYGLFIDKITTGRTLLGHGGAVCGYNSYVGFYPDTKVAAIVLGNVRGPMPWIPAEIAWVGAAVVHGDPSPRIRKLQERQ